MSHNEIHQSLNKVFQLMMENKFREDMDDTLLEKLLSIIKLKISQECSSDNALAEELTVLQDLLSNTEVFHLAEKVIMSLNNRFANISSSIQKFTIELFGIFFRNKNVFLLYKESTILRDLSNILRKNTTRAYSSTVQSALLLCFTNIAKHFEGIMWLKEQDLIQLVFLSFSSLSYHVRAKAILFFTDVLSLWISSHMSLITSQEQFFLNNILKDIVLDLINGIHLDDLDQESNTTDCCLLALKNSCEIPNVMELIKNSSVLKQQFLHYFDCLSKSDTVNEKVLNLLCFFTSGGASELFIQDILKSLSSRLLFASAIGLIGSILRFSKQSMHISKFHIQFLTLPLKILAGNSLQKDMANIFGLCCPEIYDLMSKVMEVKSDCIQIIITSILSLSKLADSMDQDALEDTLMSISIIVTGPTCCQHHPMSYVCLEHRRILFALLELFSSVLNENVYALLKFQSQLNVAYYLMCSVEKPFDYNVTTEALKLLGILIRLNDRYSISLPDETKEKLAHLLCKKLLDKAETIVMSAMSVAGLLMSEDGNLFWKNTVLKQNLHLIVWEMGVDGVQEGMLKAASLQVTLQACKVSHFWEDIQSVKKVDEGDMMKIFFRYYHSSDFYVQRESLTCIWEWLKDKEVDLPPTCRDPLLIILSDAVKSLDMDQKDIALKTWTCLMKSEKFFPGASASVESLLTAVSESGFASSLVVAIEDSDESIQYKAAEILINFRKTLVKMGCTSDYNESQCTKSNRPQKESENDFSFEHFSKEKRDAEIENVLKMTTAEQIAKLAFIPDVSSDDNSVECVPFQVDTLFFPINSFLTYVWSSNLDCIISKPDVSTDLFSEYTLSLLDDIIASDVTGICRQQDDVPDCY